MSLITIKTQLDSDLSDKDASVLRCATALHHSATIIKCENERFWNTPTERLLAILNNDISLTLATFEANTSAGVAINALLDAVDHPSLTVRIPVEPGRSDIVFNGERFIYTESLSG